MEWNYDMKEAPRGHYETREHAGKDGKIISRDVFVPEKIIACDKSGQTVTVSHWIPPTDKSPGRWCMFATTETPLAWMPWPKHPAAIRQLGETGE